MTSIANVFASPRDGGLMSTAGGRRAVLRVTIVGLVPVVIALMDWVYVHSLLGRFGEIDFPKFPNAHHPFEYRMLCWTLGTIPALWLLLDARRPSQVMTWIFYLMVHVSTAVMTPHAYLPWTQGAAMLLLMVGGLMILQTATLLPPLRLPNVQLSRPAFWLVLGAFSVAAYVVTIRAFGSIMRFVSLAEIYLQRGVWIEQRGDTLTGYLMMWQSVAINPLLIAYGGMRRKAIPLLLGLGGQVFLFSVAAQRHLLALPLAMIGLYVLMGKTGRHFGIKVLLGTALAFSIPVMLGDNFSEMVVLIVDLLLFRVFLNGGFLSALYFDFFARNPSVGFTQVKPLSWMFASPYHGSYKEALAWDVWGRYNDPNANIFADGFAQLGVSGVLIESAGLAIVLWLLDSVCHQRRYAVTFVALMLGTQLGSITNGQIPNMILGGGLALLLVLMFVMPTWPELTDSRETAPS